MSFGCLLVFTALLAVGMSQEMFGETLKKVTEM